METIRSAAVRWQGQVFVGFSHCDAWHQCFGDSIDDTVDFGNVDEVEGFVTSKGRFVDRREALAIAQRADQVFPSYLPREGLLAEDLVAA
jgi:hypothetical protein